MRILTLIAQFICGLSSHFGLFASTILGRILGGLQWLRRPLTTVIVNVALVQIRELSLQRGGCVFFFKLAPLFLRRGFYLVVLGHILEKTAAIPLS